MRVRAGGARALRLAYSPSSRPEVGRAGDAVGRQSQSSRRRVLSGLAVFAQFAHGVVLELAGGTRLAAACRAAGAQLSPQVVRRKRKLIIRQMPVPHVEFRELPVAGLIPVPVDAQRATTCACSAGSPDDAIRDNSIPAKVVDVVAANDHPVIYVREAPTKKAVKVSVVEDTASVGAPMSV